MPEEILDRIATFLKWHGQCFVSDFSVVAKQKRKQNCRQFHRKPGGDFKDQNRGQDKNDVISSGIHWIQRSLSAINALIRHESANSLTSVCY